MLNFVLALQSPAVSKDWDYVSRICERTLRSICQQTSDRFRVFLSCNERPRMNFDHPAIRIIEEAFPLPEPTFEGRMTDKWIKLRRSLMAAGEHGDGYVMFADADDCVHRDLAAFVAAHPGVPGWRFTRGYMHDIGSRWFVPVNQFDMLCGTSAIVWLKANEFPPDMTSPRENYFILCQGHAGIAEYMAKRGTSLQPLPFVGAVYNTGTGENSTGFSLRRQGRRTRLARIFSLRPLTPRIREAFGLTIPT
jgi:hypothetical protein